MYNMGFTMRNTAEEASFIAGLQLEGVEVRCVNGCWLCWGLSEDNREYIERHAAKFWAL